MAERKAINIFEELTWQVLGEALPRIPDACRCEQCQLDIYTLALNKLPPHYVTGKRQFQEMMRVKRVEYHNRIADAIVQAVAKVRSNPRAECRKLGFWAQNERKTATEYEGPRAGAASSVETPALPTTRSGGTGALSLGPGAPPIEPAFTGLPMDIEVAEDVTTAPAPAPRLPAAKYTQYGTPRKRY